MNEKDGFKERIIYTLGAFDVLESGISLVRKSAGSKKIWELFKFMLSHKEQTFTPEALIDHLWVSEAYNDPRSTLRRQMHRLRQALNETADDEATILFESGYYKWNSNKPYCLDVQIFEQLVQDAVTANSKGDNELALKLYLEAIALYKGDYLPDCMDQHWVFPIRYHYKRIFLRTVIGAIELLKTLHRYDEIVDICQKAMKLDIYEEPFHIHYMEALAYKESFKQALEHYEYITGFYYRELGIKPSNELKAVYKKLLQTNTGEVETAQLEKDTLVENAFFCETEVFKSIYELQRRRSERSNEAFSLGILAVPESKGDMLLSHLRDHLMTHLRKGDVLSYWGKYQLVLLLPSVDAKLFEKVISRVLSLYPHSSGVEIVQVSETLPNVSSSGVVERKIPSML